MLREVTKPADAAGLKQQIQQIADLTCQYPHTTTLIEENTEGKPHFNCYQLALGLRDFKFHNGFWTVFLGRDFVEFLVNALLEETDIQNATNGDIVIYVDSEIEHAGRIRNGPNEAVESKWGLGHVWCHDVYEVPENYGDTVRFFKGISQEESIRAVHDFHPTWTIDLPPV